MFGNGCKNCDLLDERYNTLSMLVDLKDSQLITAHELNNTLVNCLKEIAKDKDEGCAEGYYGTYAYNVLKGLNYIKE